MILRPTVTSIQVFMKIKTKKVKWLVKMLFKLCSFLHKGCKEVLFKKIVIFVLFVFRFHFRNITKFNNYCNNIIIIGFEW